MSITFSCIIPCSAKDFESQNLKDLIESIRTQDFPQEQIEILTITEGDSEQAKAIGIRRAKGEICAMFCADNYLVVNNLFTEVHKIMSRLDVTGVFSRHYLCFEKDNSLNRYFSMIGSNDPIAFYLNKADRKPYYEQLDREVSGEMVVWRYSNMRLPSLGDNGFFVKRDILMKYADLDHYYPMDVYVDINKINMLSFARLNSAYIWHRTSDNLISFLKKRYKYARDLYSDRSDRRWCMVETDDDIRRLWWFITSCITVLPCLLISIRGFSKIKDPAWAWHWPVCLSFLITYGLLTCRNILKRLSLFARTKDLTYLRSALNPFSPVTLPTTRSL